MNINKSLPFDIKKSNIDSLLCKSKYQILNFKRDLNKLYNLIFDFCSKNNIIISNYNINISIYNKIKYDLLDLENDFKFNLLSINPYKDALKLSNLLYNSYSQYIVMSSYLRNKEIIITIDNNKIIQFQLLFLYVDEKKKLNNIKFTTFDMNFNNKQYKLNYSTDLYELLLLTHKLYHPTYFLKFYKENNSLTNIFSQLILSLLKSNELIVKKLEYEYKNKVLENIRNNLIKSIYLDIYSDIKIILLDNYAIKSILNNNIDINNLNYNDILHIIIESKYLDYIIKILNDYIDSNLDSKQYNILIKTNTVYIINDFRFKRKNIILFNKETGKKNTVLYIYNSLDYEVIPTILENKILYIPHFLVILRFLIINLYFMQLFDPLYDKTSYNKFIQKISNIIIINTNEKSLFKKYNLINYIGVFIDERIDKFKLGSFIYRPWQYNIQNKTLLS